MIARTLIALTLLVAGLAAAEDFDYALRPRQLAADTWVLVGKTEDFDTRNGGNIVNVGFIVTEAGVVVIDTGPSRRYGEQLRLAIASVTPRPVLRVIVTHHHPDHFLGNQAFGDVEIGALPATIDGIANEGAGFTDNLFRMSGAWMAGTEPVVPRRPLSAGEITVGGHRLELLALAGHTAGDLAVFDHTTGVLFTGDLAFFNRAPTTPHADIGNWLGSLDVLSRLPFRVLVPGHGEPVTDGRAIRQTREYLLWLERTLRQAAERGMDMNEVLATPVPTQFREMAIVRREFTRSVTHLYPELEAAELRRSDAVR